MTTPTFTAQAGSIMPDGKSGRASIHWRNETHRFHMWVFPDDAGGWGLAPADQVIHKNPIVQASHKGGHQALSVGAKANQKVAAAALAYANSGAIEADVAARVQAKAHEEAEALALRATTIRAALQTSLDVSLRRAPTATRAQAQRDALWFFESMTDQEIDHMRDRINGLTRA